MPTNLPDRRDQEVQSSEDSLLYVMIVMVVGMLTAIILNIVVA
jgi:hypothetical protein